MIALGGGGRRERGREGWMRGNGDRDRVIVNTVVVQ
jgi:hypothetical protein